MSRPRRDWPERARRLLLRHRHVVAAVLAAAAVASAVAALAPPPERTVGVIVAARDLSSGAVLDVADLATVQLPVDRVPDGVLRATTGHAAATGRTLAAPARRGEPLTDVRLVAPSLLRGYDRAGGDVVAAPVRLADAEVVDLLMVGDRVDVLAASAASEPAAGDPTGDPAGNPAAGVAGEGSGGPGGTSTAGLAVRGGARSVARDAPVVAVPDRGGGEGLVDAGGPGEGGLVVLAVPRAVAADLAAAAVTATLSVTLRGP